LLHQAVLASDVVRLAAGLYALNPATPLSNGAMNETPYCVGSAITKHMVVQGHT